MRERDACSSSHHVTPRTRSDARACPLAAARPAARQQAAAARGRHSQGRGKEPRAIGRDAHAGCDPSGSRGRPRQGEPAAGQGRRRASSPADRPVQPAGRGRSMRPDRRSQTESRRQAAQLQDCPRDSLSRQTASSLARRATDSTPARARAREQHAVPGRDAGPSRASRDRRATGFNPEPQAWGSLADSLK